MSGDGTTPAPHVDLVGAVVTVVESVRRRASTRGASVALIRGDVQVSFGELSSRVDEVAAAMRSMGIARGSRVAFLGRNSIEFFEVLLGAASLGAVTVPVSWRLAAPEIAAILGDSGAALVLADVEFLDLLGDGQVIVAIGAAPHGHVAYDVWSCSPGDSRLGDPPAARLDDPVLQLYTSGTTGLPKGVVSSHGAVAKSLALLADVAGMSPASVTLCTLPTFHIGGTSWTLAALASGGATVLLTEVTPSAILDAIARWEVSEMIAVPTIIQRVVEALDVGTRDVSHLSMIYYGGGPMTSHVIERALAAFGCRFVQGFGLTELPLVSVLPAEAHRGDPRLLRSCGRPARETEVRLVDPDTGREVAVGETGEIQVRSPRLMSGYWGKPELTDAVLDQQGWFRTGDAASRDEEGYLFIRDRIKDMIISGGENIYPAEVENVLMAHPDVSEVAVVGVASERWTEAVTAVVVRRSGSAPDAESLISFCREHLAGFKCPRDVVFTDELPRTPTGKLLKYQLREQLN
jgi:long-chain acyl-CoA synthetase